MQSRHGAAERVRVGGVATKTAGGKATETARKGGGAAAMDRGDETHRLGLDPDGHLLQQAVHVEGVDGLRGLARQEVDHRLQLLQQRVAQVGDGAPSDVLHLLHGAVGEVLEPLGALCAPLAFGLGSGLGIGCNRIPSRALELGLWAKGEGIRDVACSTKRSVLFVSCAVIEAIAPWMSALVSFGLLAATASLCTTAPTCRTTPRIFSRGSVTYSSCGSCLRRTAARQCKCRARAHLLLSNQVATRCRLGARDSDGSRWL